jgi:hypothetical protein
MRIKDTDVERFLIWGRNYGEIESFKKLDAVGRKWVIKLPPGRTFTASGMNPGMLERAIVPDEFVLTSREALTFGFGLAIAGGMSRTRDEHAKREWGW